MPEIIASHIFDNTHSDQDMNNCLGPILRNYIPHTLYGLFYIYNMYKNKFNINR